VAKEAAERIPTGIVKLSVDLASTEKITPTLEVQARYVLSFDAPFADLEVGMHDHVYLFGPQ
jgi:hypothetical protein